MTHGERGRHSREFFEHFSAGAARSAAVVLPMVQSMVSVTSVADFGCGSGEWMRAWQRLGVNDIVGCDVADIGTPDGASPAWFVSQDLSQPVWLGRHFALAQSLEVGEHLPAAAAETYVETLVAHARVILFSAAAPGQGGEYHVNEQPLEYWRRLFHKHHYGVVDALRPRLLRDRRVESWYRYNCVLFVHDSRYTSRSALCDQIVPAGVALTEFAPPLVRAWRTAAARVPEPIMTRAAMKLRRIRRRWLA